MRGLYTNFLFILYVWWSNKHRNQIAIVLSCCFLKIVKGICPDDFHYLN
jgi:hypothetical protein